MDIKILIATHKQAQMPKEDIYLPVHVGKALHPDVQLGIQTDNEGDNISTKNPYYSELTAMYWAWKNIKADYIGLSHYRRLFAFKRKLKDWDRILTKKEAEALCQKYDVILPKKRKWYIETVYSHYDHTLDGKHLDDTAKIIEELFPDYLPFFHKAMKRREEHLFNMFIMKWNLFDNYCNFMFPILQRLEQMYDLKSMDPFQARLIGRMGERLLDVWLMKNNLT